MKNENGIEKSAILKGQTLVNLLTQNSSTNLYTTRTQIDRGYRYTQQYSASMGATRLQWDTTNNGHSRLKPNTKYYVQFTVKVNKGRNVRVSFEGSNEYAATLAENSTTTIKCSVRCGESLQRFFVYVYPPTDESYTGDTFDILDFMIIEYVEGMENWDIPYFEGMQSVKMPVLTTTGKNLFSPTKMIINDGALYGYYKYKNDESVRCTLSISDKDTSVDVSGIYFGTTALGKNGDGGHDWLVLRGGITRPNTMSLTTNFNFISIYPNNIDTLNKLTKRFNVQVEYGEVKTTYEPHKSNILTANEPVELRGIGDVKDELNVATGELTERIGEIVLDGSEGYSKYTSACESVYGFSKQLFTNSNEANTALCDKLPVKRGKSVASLDEEGIFFRGDLNVMYLKISKSKLSDGEPSTLKEWLSENNITFTHQLKEKVDKTVDLTIQDQENQPQERMKLFPNGYINTSSSTFPPILELKGITHNNKLNMTTTNGTNNTQLTTLDNLALDGIVCRDGTVVRDSYDVESGVYTKRVFRFTIDEEFIERYRSEFVNNGGSATCFEYYINVVNSCNFPQTGGKGIASNISWDTGGEKNRIITSTNLVYIRLLKEEVSTYDVDGLLEWIKRNGTIEVAYQMATPQIIHMQPNMTPYVSTRPYQGSIESQGNILESSFLDYTSEQSIISPKPLGDGDVLRWEQGSQCYVYENDKEYIPLTDYNQLMGTVLDLEEEDGEQFVENLDGGDIIVDVPFKEKAVYERHLVSHEDKVIYPTQDKLDPTGKIEVDYICGETWQNPNDLSDIRHVGTLREDGQYDVTIRRSGDDEIRLMNGTTHLSLDGDGLNPSEFELTFLSSGGVEVGKYGDTIHMLEDCVLDSKLETGTVYGNTEVVNEVVNSTIVNGFTVTNSDNTEMVKYTLPSPITLNKIGDVADTYDVVSGIETRRINPETLEVLATSQTIQHTLIPSTVETMQEPTFILPQPLRSVPNGICDRLYWDENKGHYCIEKRIGVEVFDGVNNFNLDVTDGQLRNRFVLPLNNMFYINNATLFYYTNSNIFPQLTYNEEYNEKQGLALYNNGNVYFRYSSNISNAQFKQLLIDNPVYIYYALNTSEIIDLPHLNKKLTLPTHPNTLPIGHKVEHSNANPQLGLTIPYKQLNYPSRPQNIDFRMDIADYVLTWDDVKEARQYNIILNDRVIATVKEPQWNSGEEMYGYIMVEAQNELAENLSEELYIKTVPNAPAQLTVGHNPMTDYYDFEISFIKTSAIAEYYTVQYRIDGGEWVYKTIQSDEIDPNSKVLWRFSVYEINEQIEVWATATNEIGTNDILPIATYYMSPTPQWTYRINSKELFVRWMDDSPYDTQYKLRYQYKSDGIYRYAYFEGDKQEIGKLYEALIPLADDEEVTIALCIISEKENLYTKPIKASKELDPNIKPPRNFNYHWLARGLIEFYWEDNYDVDVEYEAIVEHRLTSGSNEWITDTRIFSATDTEGTGTIYRLSYQMEDLEEIRARVRMKWAMNETEWSESLTTVFIPVEGNPPQWIRRTQTQEGLLVEWEAQEYVDSYHVYVMSNGEELQHLETMDNFIYVDLDYSNPIDIEIYEATRFSGGIQSDPTDKMCFRPTMDKHQLIHDVVTPDTLTYVIEVDTVQKGIKERQQMHDINTTPGVKTKEPMDVAIKSPFTLSYHPLQLDVHQAAAKYYGTTELNIKTLDVKSRDAIEVLSFERVTDQYGVDFTVYTPSASKYPITLEVNRVRIVCFGDSLTSGHPGFWE